MNTQNQIIKENETLSNTHPTPKNFDKHLDKIKIARQRTKKILEAIIPCFDSAEASISLLWESVFDYLVIHENKHQLAEISTLAGVLQKLMASFNQFKTLELKTHEHEMKKEEFDLRIQEVKDKLLPQIKKGEPLSLEALLDIETQLNLL